MALDWMRADKTNLFVCVAPFEFIVLLLVGTSTKKGEVSQSHGSHTYTWIAGSSFSFPTSLSGDYSCIYIFSLPLADFYQAMDILQQISQTVVY